MTIFISIIQALIIPALSPLVVGVIRKIKAKLQNRVGASVLQPYRDLWKLFHKDEVISEDTSWIFRFTPYLIFSITIIVAASLPIFMTNSLISPAGDFLVVISLLALSTFFLALAGLDAGSAFGGIGSSREMTVASLVEGALVFTLLAAALAAGTTNLPAAVSALGHLSLAAFIPLVIAFIGFLIVLIAETGRIPVDNPATHLELTMIHEAMILEYSGKRLALIEWAASNKFLIFGALAANLFFPWGIAQGSASIILIISAAIIFFIKVFVLAAGVAILESSIAKLRFFRVPDLVFTAFILGAIAVGIILI